MKVVPFYPNSPDNLHCLQACIKSVTQYYFPDKHFSDKEIDVFTCFESGWSWIIAAVNWLDELGLQIKLYSPFPYDQLILEGEKFMKKFKGEAVYEYEKQNGSYKNLPLIQKSAELMITRKLWEQNKLNNSDLAQLLKNEQVLAIGKTVYEWLSGNYLPLEKLHSHYVLIIKEYSPGIWKVHDPGLPPAPERKVSNTINNHDIFGDILVIARNMSAKTNIKNS